MRFLFLCFQARAARARLVPPQIGRDGSLQEWADDWASLEKNHRHFSHLYGLYPGNVLWEKRNPELLEAYKKVLNERGDGGKGFSTVLTWRHCCNGAFFMSFTCPSFQLIV